MPGAQLWIGTGIGATGLLAGLWREWIARRERRRSRPIVLANEERNCTWGDSPQDPEWYATAYLTNESSAEAVNVRFGIELDGVRFPYKHMARDEEASRINVVAPGARVPSTGAYKIPIPSEFNWAGGGDPDPGRAYWCRYRDLAGQTWETRNPWRRSDNFTIKRVHQPRLVVWRAQRRRNRIIARGTKVLRELPEAMKAEAERQQAAREKRQHQAEKTPPHEP